MTMNEKLYNELLEYCAGDLDELERTINYFRMRLDSDRDVDLDNYIADELEDMLDEGDEE